MNYISDKELLNKPRAGGREKLDSVWGERENLIKPKD